MPFIAAKTNVSISPQQEEKLRIKLGEAIALLPGKSEQWLMLEFDGDQHMAFAGSTESCAMVRVTVYGRGNPDAYSKLTEAITHILWEELRIPQDRIYVAYLETDNWGWNGSNF